MKTVRVKVDDWSGVALPIQFLVIGPVVVVGVVLLVPFIVALEVRAWLARHQMKKEAS